MKFIFGIWQTLKTLSLNKGNRTHDIPYNACRIPLSCSRTSMIPNFFLLVKSRYLRPLIGDYLRRRTLFLVLWAVTYETFDCTYRETCGEQGHIVVNYHIIFFFTWKLSMNSRLKLGEENLTWNSQQRKCMPCKIIKFYIQYWTGLNLPLRFRLEWEPHSFMSERDRITAHLE